MKYTYHSGTRPLDGFTIKRGIGIGGFGEVYFAVSDAGKEVALKKIQRNLDVELRGMRQCLNLKHVNLISLWDIRSSHEGESWVVMEYVPGPNLRDAIEASPAGMAEDQVKIWFTATASGVAYLHERGIVHRDLKPANIFCDDHQQVIKIGDYGLSKFISCSRRSGQTESVGTFHYMAPEIGNGIYGKEIDIYALGIILFEMLTGDVPFEGESTQEIIMKHLTADPDLSRAPESFRPVISKSLQKDPQQRYHSLQEMLCDLPWLEVAENSERLVSWHRVGGIIETAGIPKASHAWPTDAHPIGRSRATQYVAEPTVVSPTSPLVIGQQTSAPNATLTEHNEVVVPNMQFGLVSPAAPDTNTNAISETSPLDNVHLSAAPVQSASRVPLLRRSLSENTQAFKRWWNSSSVSTPVKMLLLGIAGLIAIKQSNWLLPAALGVGLVYLIWYACFAPAVNPDKDQNGNSTTTLSKRDRRRRELATLRNWLASRPQADRLTEVTGSLLGSALSCLVLNFLGLVFCGTFLDPSLESWSLYLWMTLTGIACCWTAVLAGKSWEVREGHGRFRRVFMLLSGFAIGVVAFSIATLLETDLAPLVSRSDTAGKLVLTNIALLPACVLLFCGLFGLLRWWRQTDPVRRTRISIWSVGMCLAWAILLAHVLNLPALYICVLVMAVSISIQFASPWLHPDQKHDICIRFQSESAN